MTQLKLQALPSGARIGVYEIKGVIRSDWSGILYRAWNEHLNSMVAIKEYLPDGYSFKAKFSKDVSVYEYGMKKFLQLADLLAEVRQPNVVSVHNVLQFNGTAYLIMDFVNGTPLSKIHDHFPTFTDAESKKILKSLLDALHAIHDKKIIHGNINPSNIIIRDNGEPVLINFASANIALLKYCKQIQQSTSPNFIAINNHQTDNQFSPNSDLYSLGASIFYSITNSKPETILARKKALNNNAPDPCQIAMEQVGAGLSEVLLKTILLMLSFKPEQRAQSACEVLENLDQETAESDKQKDKKVKLKAKSSRSWLLQYGLIGVFALIVIGFFYNIRQTIAPEDIRNDYGRNSLQLVVSEQENLELQLDIKQEQEINRHLVAAKSNLDMFNLTTPADSNAYDQYQAVLSMDQGNPLAIKGLQGIFKIYIKFIKSSVKEGKLRRAKIYIKRAEAIQPDSPELHWLRKKITK